MEIRSTSKPVKIASITTCILVLLLTSIPCFYGIYKLYNNNTLQSNNWIDYVIISVTFIRLLISIGLAYGFCSIKNMNYNILISYKQLFNKTELNIKKIKKNKKTIKKYIILYIIFIVLYMYYNIIISESNINSINIILLNGNEPIMFGISFHLGYLVLIFIYDSIITKYFGPSFDFGRVFITVFIFYSLFIFILYFIIIGINNSLWIDIFGIISLFLLMIISFIILKNYLFRMNNYFPVRRSGFFMLE